MPYEIDFWEDKKIVIIRNIGEMPYIEYEKETIEALELAQNKNTSLFLVDNTHLISVASTFEVVDFPDMYERLGAPKTNKIALLMPIDSIALEKTKFFETVCFNRGYLAKIFESKNDAIDWLLSE